MTETEPDPDPGVLVKVEFNRTMAPGEDVFGTMWVLGRNESAIHFSGLLVDDPDRIGSISGPVYAGAGADPEWGFHFDPDSVSFWGTPMLDPRGSCRWTDLSEIENEIVSGDREWLCHRQIRVLEVLPEPD